MSPRNTRKPAIRLPNASKNRAPHRARSAAKGMDTWRESGGAPNSRSARIKAEAAFKEGSSPRPSARPSVAKTAANVAKTAVKDTAARTVKAGRGGAAIAAGMQVPVVIDGVKSLINHPGWKSLDNKPAKPGGRTKADTIGNGKTGSGPGAKRNGLAERMGPPVPDRIKNAPKAQQLPSPQSTSSNTSGAGAKGSAGSSRPSPSIPRAAMPAAGKQPASNAGMKNQDKNYRGNPDKAGSIASQLKELRSMGGDRTSGAGPVKDGQQYADKIASSKKPGTKKPSLQEQIRKRRLGL